MMRADLSKLVKALGNQKPPKHIWQKPFDGYQFSNTYHRALCSLNGAEPDPNDLTRYDEDMHYGSAPLQPDLLRYLLPICLEAWRKDLMANERTQYGGFADWFWSTVAESSVLQDNLTPDEYAAVAAFMREAILDRIDENPLSFSDTETPPCTWFGAFCAYGVAFPAFPALWTAWWEMTTAAQAYAVLQYLSCLLYKSDENPFFAYRVYGGLLWAPAGHIYRCGWRPENVAFLRATLTPDYIEDRLRYAAHTLGDVVQSPIPKQMVEEFPSRKAVLELHLAELPALLLAVPLEASSDWSDGYMFVDS
jgi:hypothetical protein